MPEQPAIFGAFRGTRRKLAVALSFEIEMVLIFREIDAIMVLTEVTNLLRKLEGLLAKSYA